MTNESSLFLDFSKEMGLVQEITIENKVKDVLGIGFVDLKNGSFKCVLLVKGLNVNLCQYTSVQLGYWHHQPQQ
jgi:hypothetical protein